MPPTNHSHRQLNTLLARPHPIVSTWHQIFPQLIADAQRIVLATDVELNDDGEDGRGGEPFFVPPPRPLMLMRAFISTAPKALMRVLF